MNLFDSALRIARVVKTKPITSWILDQMGALLLQLGDYEQAKVFFEESLEVNRKTGDRTAVAYRLGSLGCCARLQGNFSTANSFYADALQAMKQSGDDNDVMSLLIDIGILFGARGEPEKSVRLLGFAESLFQGVVRIFILPFARLEAEKFRETARAALTQETYTTAYEAGKRMSLDEAVAFALKELGQ